MLLRGVDFGYCWDQSGVRGFFGEGYWYHKPLRPIGLRFKGSTFVAKTTTYGSRLDPPNGLGNMPMKEDGITPAEWMPKCIVVDIAAGLALNAVGLSGPGAVQLLERGIWQERSDAFFLSFMSVAKDEDARLSELLEFVKLLNKHLPRFKGKVGLQINFTCPTIKLDRDADDLGDEIRTALNITASLGVPVVPKLSVALPVSLAERVSRHPNCDALMISNTIPWGQLPHLIDWNKAFKSGGVSPLARLGGGGLSGKPLFPIVKDWVRTARKEAKITLPLNVGGGITRPRDAVELADAGASSVAIGSMSFLRPHRVQATINRVMELACSGQFYIGGH